jgi:hypothetical protein
MNLGIAIRSRARVAIGAALIVWLGVLADANPGLAATADQAPPLAPGQARVWFLRQLTPGTAMHAPMIYANGKPLAIMPEGTVFYRDFAPGAYVFTVENCLPEPQTSYTLTLGTGNEFALEVQSDENSAWDCEPSQISYLRPPPADMLSSLFAPLAYLGQNLTGAALR